MIDGWSLFFQVKLIKGSNSTFKSLAAISDGYEIRYIENGQEISVKARAVIGADGAFSRVRSYLNKDMNSPERYIAMQEWFECPGYISYFTAIFDEEISDFYSWVIPKDHYLLLGAALKPKENTREKFELLKTKLTSRGFDFNKKIKTEGAYIYRTKKISQFFAGRDGIALIGEAAGAISPSSAEGISYALKSALYLARSFEEGIDGFLDRYKQNIRDIKLNLWIKTLKSPALYHPLLRKLAMKSGLQTIR